MKITTKVSGTSRAEIVERAEAAARQLLDGSEDLTQCAITYGDGEAETVDTRPGRPTTRPQPEHLQIVFTVQVTIEVTAW